MNLGMFLAPAPLGDAFKGTFAGAGSMLKNIGIKFLWGFVIIAIVGAIAYFAYKKYKDKAFYKTPITLTVLMENGMEKTRTDLRGGMFSNKGIQDFKIRAPRKRKKHILGYIPDLSKSNSVDGRIHFITSGDKTIWQQVESDWVLKGTKNVGGTIYEYDLIQTPISRETKQITINSIKNWRDTIDKTKLTAYGIAIGAFIVMVIAHLISLFIQTKIRCGTP